MPSRQWGVERGIGLLTSRCLSGEEGGRDQPDGDAAEGAHDDGLTLLAQVRRGVEISLMEILLRVLMMMA